MKKNYKQISVIYNAKVLINREIVIYLLIIIIIITIIIITFIISHLFYYYYYYIFKRRKQKPKNIFVVKHLNKPKTL